MTNWEPPRHEPRPWPPRHEPHPGPEPWPDGHRRPHPPHPPDRDHGGFPPGRRHMPPPGGGWGWHDRDRWNQGYDPWFWRQDPNFPQWEDPINREASNIAMRMDFGDTQGAADQLAMDLYQTRGDRYAQDQLLSEVARRDIKGFGGDLYLQNWNPDRGTWDDIYVVPSDGSNPISIPTYDYDDPEPWDR